jgi:hypothetical protein
MLVETCRSSEHSSVTVRAFLEMNICSISFEVSSGERGAGGISLNLSTSRVIRYLDSIAR